jgi:hypothetical protein
MFGSIQIAQTVEAMQHFRPEDDLMLHFAPSPVALFSVTASEVPVGVMGQEQLKVAHPLRHRSDLTCVH